MADYFKLSTRMGAAAAAAFILTGCMVSPVALEPGETGGRAATSLRAAFDRQEPVTKPIDLAEAMARAVLYNLDNRVEMFEIALRSNQLDSASLSMLPSLVASAGYAGRDKFDASSSRSMITGQQSLETSTSQDRDIFTRDLALSWNVLDFGLSYIRAKQAADRVLVAEEQRRKVMARIVEEVRGAYWRALAAEYLGRDLKAIQGRLQSALRRAEELREGGQAGPVVALSYQRDLYELTERIQLVEAEVASARNQLAALMNLPPGVKFSLVRPASVPLRDRAPGDPAALVTSALENRPEMRAVLYDQRMVGLDGTAALLELLPGVSLNAGRNYTSNSFTFENDWWGWGSRASWNLLRLASYPSRRNEAQARDQLMEEKVKATAAAIALQVHVSRTRYERAVARAKTLGQFNAVQQNLLQQLSASASAAQTGEIDLVREQLTALLARARYDVAMAEAQSAYAAMQTTIGRDPYPVAESDSLQALAAAFRRDAAGAARAERAGAT